MSVTYSQLDREARKAAKLAQCAAERATFLAALTEKRRAPPFTSGVWTHGMLYVALGRVTDPDNLRVVAPKQPGDAVVNVVYMDVLEVGEARRSTQVG